MNTSTLIAEIDAEIAKLQSARASIASLVDSSKRGPGRPPKSPTSTTTKLKKNTMSAEGRARIAEAQKKRWAAKKKAVKT